MDPGKDDPHKINLENLKKKSLSLEEIEKLINDLNIQNNNNGKIVVQSIPPKPILQDLKPLNFDDKLKAIQQYVNAFEYNFTNLQLSTYQKKKTFSSMVDYAKILIKKSFPIRCLDGFILAAYLTCDIDKNCIRFPLRFMSKCNDKLYWHIVLGIKHNRRNKFGSIGISRKNEKLSFKQCKYNSLLSLIKDFIACYEFYNHKVNMITIGVPLTSNQISEDPIFWDILQIYNKETDNDIHKYNNILNQIFENLFKSKDVIFRSLTEEIKPYLFDPNIMFDTENQKYYLKQQYTLLLDSNGHKMKLNKHIKPKYVSQRSNYNCANRATLTNRIYEKSKFEDINRV